MKNLNVNDKYIRKLMLQHKLKLADRDKAKRKLNFNNNKKESDAAIWAKSFIHPAMLKLQTANRKKQSLDYNILNDGRSYEADKPIIFAVSHIGKFDIEIVGEAIQDHFYLLSADQEQMYYTLEGLFLKLNGVIYFDFDDKEDGRIAKEKAVELLLKRQNVMWFPEGTWNLSESLPILAMKYGIIDAAKEADALILPIAIEQVGKDKKDFIINIGDYIDINKNLETNKLDYNFDNKVASINHLRDDMATLKWKLWEADQAKDKKLSWIFSEETMAYNKNLTINRDTIDDDYYYRFLQAKANEWPHWEIKDVITRASKYIDGKKAVSYEEVFGLDPYPELTKYNAYVKQLKK